MPADQHKDLELLIYTAYEAGSIATSFFKNAPRVWMKSGNSPVTEADLAVNNFLEDHLQAQRPLYGWLSEESPDHPKRLQADKVFIVDPIDGTRGFINGRDDWTISLAIIQMSQTEDHKRYGRPIAAALYNPIRDEMFSACSGYGAYMNKTKIQTSAGDNLDGISISMPNALLEKTHIDRHDIRRAPNFVSLAYRLAQVANGCIDTAIARPNSHDWDLAAADLLLHEAGGTIINAHKQLLNYNTCNPKHGLLIAGNSKLAARLLTLIEN